MHKKNLYTVWFSLFFLLLSFSFNLVFQVETSYSQERPDRKFLFLEDRAKKRSEEDRRRAIKERQKAVSQTQKLSGLPFDINAETIDFDSKQETLNAKGNLVLNYTSMQLEADEGSFHVPSNEARVKGDIRISDYSGELSATEAALNLDTGKAKLENAEIYFLEGDYQVAAEKISRSAKDEFIFEEAKLSTCRCPEGDSCNPWQISSSEAKITRDGYGQVWNATLDVYDVPVLYIPYMIFPAKTSRQTGFLPMKVGSGGKGEFELELPFFLTLGRTADWTITPLIETKTRYGVKNELRKVFSETHNLTLGFTFTDESKRDGDLLGTNTDDLFDPTFDEERSAFYLDHLASGEILEQPFQVIIDANYVSDDLILRELDLPKIGDERSRFVTSRAIARTPLLDTYSLELSSEFNQAIVSDDDLVLQRLPELGFSGFSVFKPFGENKYGLKLVSNSDFSATQFSRDEDYDGLRLNAYQKLSTPFHYKNYFDASLFSEVYLSKYSLDNKPLEREEDDELFGIEDSSSRAVPGFGGQISTVVEKIFEVPKDSWIKRIADLGRGGRNEELSRIRHTIQPVLKYKYVPFVDQTENPQFDSIDRLSRRNVLTYELIQRIDSRFEPRNQNLYGYEELTPELGDLGSLSSSGPVDRDLTFGANILENSTYYGERRGSRRDLLTLKLGQSFDIDESINDRTEEDSLSDLYVDLAVSPNEYLRFRGRTNLAIPGGGVSSYNLLTQLVDKRGDELRAQLRFVDGSVRQLETGIQLLLTDRLKLGYYSRYDDLASEFLENRVGLRITSECNCWIFDIEALDKINPNRTTIAFTITLIGIGEFGSDFLASDREDEL